MKTLMKILKITKTAILAILLCFALPIVVIVILGISLGGIDYRYFYPFHLIFTNDEEYPKGVYIGAVDQFANAAVVEGKFNMLLIITLQKYQNDLPEELAPFRWRSIPISRKYAKFSWNNFEIGVHLHKNSLVIFDGMTNETLLIHEISSEQTRQWKKEFQKRCYDPEFNIVEDACKFFSVPKEKYRWYFSELDISPNIDNIEIEMENKTH